MTTSTFTDSSDFADDNSRTALGALVDDRVVALTDPSSTAGEQYRVLRHRLQRISRERRLTCFAVTSSTEREGKTTTAVNLALSMAAAEGCRVALVDMDLRRGRVHSLLGFAPRQGLAEVLAGEVEANGVMWRFAESGLYVMPAGRPPTDAAALLSNARAHELIAGLKARFDIVILDLPAILPIADAQVATELCDGLLLVVKAGSTTREVVEMALDSVPATKLIGCVLNGVAPNESAELAPAFGHFKPQQPARAALPPGATRRRDPVRNALPHQALGPATK